MKDLFISHASEDKDDLVRPLAEELKKYGVDIWYDEFELKVGDSLSESINYGLSNSIYGLIILSPHFFKKKWTDFELKSLLTYEIHKGKTILPIWHNISLEEVMEGSLYLADKKALKSDQGIQKLAFEIVKVVRPDILSIWNFRSVYKSIHKKSQIKDIKLSDIIPNERIHTSLPFHLVVATVVFQSIFPESCKYGDMVDGFLRDVDYDNEFAIWAVISSAYIDSIRELNLKMDSDKSKEIFYFLLNISLEMTERTKLIYLKENEEIVVLQAYYRNASMIMPLLKKKEDRILITD